MGALTKFHKLTILAVFGCIALLAVLDAFIPA